MPVSASGEVQTLCIDGHEMAFVRLNPQVRGQTHVLLHGFSGATSFWQGASIDALLERGPCWSISLPGHFPAQAAASFARQGFDLEALLEWVEATIDQLVGPQALTLVGHSTGAFVALALAARRPAQVQRVVSVCGFVQGRWSGSLGWAQGVIARFGSLGEWLVAGVFAALKSHPILYRWALCCYVSQREKLRAHPDFARLCAAAYAAYRQSHLGALTAYLRCMPDLDIEPLLGRIQAPVLLMSGAADPLVPREQSRRLRQHIPHATVVEFEHVGHLPMFEHAPAFEAALLDWLRKTDALKSATESATEKRH